VLVEEVDAVSPEALQHLLDDLADVVGSAVPPSLRELETEARREDYLVTNWLERFACLAGPVADYADLGPADC
jgi:hypothetical protein